MVESKKKQKRSQIVSFTNLSNKGEKGYKSIQLDTHF